MSFPYTSLTYNGITKIVSNELLESLTHPPKVQTFQWYRYQLLKMCEKLEIDEKIPGTVGGIYNNMTLANKIKEHSFYVVTRGGRRIEEKNYDDKVDAYFRADILRSLLKEWDPSQVNSVSVIKTEKPYRIR